MASLPMNAINHFIHPNHPLKPIDSDKEYLCDGCKTLGTGKRYRCHHGCDFDMHEYCGTCPNPLTSFMHKHTLSLVRKAQGASQVDRICDVCTEPVKGLFYRCKECEFDVHPLCTQLPQKLKHAMDKIHPLSLESPSKPGFCDVCRKYCNSWRYRCGVCDFDIHLECVLVPTVKCPKTGETNQRGINPGYGRGIPYQPPPQFVHYYPGFAHAPGYAYGQPGFNYNPHMYPNGFNYNPHMYPNGFTPQNQAGFSGTSNGTAGRFGKSMFALVEQLGFGVLSNMIFGVDLSSLF